MANIEGLTKSEAPIDPDRSSSSFTIRDFHEVSGKSDAEFEALVARFNYKKLWTYAANCIFGLWLIANPHLLEYKSQPLVMSDTVCGVLIIFFEMLSFSPRRTFFRWCTPAVALWLLFAPLVFWSPTPAVYLVDSLVGCLVITFAILVPGVPGGGGVQLLGPDMPPGWTYNPSSWIRRWLGIALALLGFFISRYLAVHQLGYEQHAWDPFFGDGTDKVIHSSVSRAFPISDAGFGSIAYIMEVLSGFMGDRARWRTTPWIAVMFAMLVLPLGITSVILVITQPVIVGAWCGLCLIAAAGLITSVPLAVHEAIAVGQFLFAAKKQKKNFWRIFWLGGTIEGAGTQDPDRMNYNLGQRYIASIQGVTLPWTIAIQLAIGIWLMARPDIIPSGVMSSNCDHLLGAMIVTVAAVASAEVTRLGRLVGIPLGVGLIAVAITVSRSTLVPFCSELVCGIALILVSIPRGEIVEKYAGWDKFVR